MSTHEMKLYAMGVYAYNIRSGQFYMSGWYGTANSEAEAIGLGISKLKQIYSSQDGWTNHICNVNYIPLSPEEVVKVNSYIKSSKNFLFNAPVKEDE